MVNEFKEAVKESWRDFKKDFKTWLADDDTIVAFMGTIFFLVMILVVCGIVWLFANLEWYMAFLIIFAIISAIVFLGYFIPRLINQYPPEE